MPSKIAGKVPVTLALKIIPALSVVAAVTALVFGWAFAGLVNPGMVNMIIAPELNIPELNVIVNTFDAESAAVPAGAGFALGGGEVNVSDAEPELASAIPAPASEMIILPLLGT